MLARSQKCLQYIGLVLISTEVEIPGNRLRGKSTIVLKTPLCNVQILPHSTQL
jgi:hypothetical protein